MPLIRHTRPKESGYTAKSISPPYEYNFIGDTPVMVTKIASVKLLTSSNYELVDPKEVKYSKVGLERMSMKQLREIGTPLGAKDTSKKELIDEIIEKQG